MALTKDGLVLREILFGIHLHVDITLSPPLGEQFYREITKVRSDLFTTKFIQAGAPFILLHEKTQNRCVITDNNLTYTERSNFDPDRFLEISTYLARTLIQSFECSEDNVRVLGKLFRYRANYPGIFSSFKRAVAMFANDDIGRLQIRTLFRRNGKNIHLNISGIEKEGEVLPDSLAIECDINNADQHAHHTITALADIFKFADNYNDRQLIDLLNKKLNVQKVS